MLYAKSITRTSVVWRCLVMCPAWLNAKGAQNSVIFPCLLVGYTSTAYPTVTFQLHKVTVIQYTFQSDYCFALSIFSFLYLMHMLWELHSNSMQWSLLLYFFIYMLLLAMITWKGKNEQLIHKCAAHTCSYIVSMCENNLWETVFLWETSAALNLALHICHANRVLLDWTANSNLHTQIRQLVYQLFIMHIKRGE